MSISAITTLRCFFTGHKFEKQENCWNDGSFFFCPQCGMTLWRHNIKYRRGNAEANIPTQEYTDTKKP